MEFLGEGEAIFFGVFSVFVTPVAWKFCIWIFEYGGKHIFCVSVGGISVAEESGIDGKNEFAAGRRASVRGSRFCGFKACGFSDEWPCEEFDHHGDIGTFIASEGELGTLKDVGWCLGRIAIFVNADAVRKLLLFLFCDHDVASSHDGTGLVEDERGFAESRPSKGHGVGSEDFSGSEGSDGG